MTDTWQTSDAEREREKVESMVVVVKEDDSGRKTECV